MALVTRNKDKGCLCGSAFYAVQAFHVECDTFKHGLPYPSKNGDNCLNKANTVVCCDFIEVAIGFPVDFTDILVLGFSILFHKISKVFISEYEFF